ncbi:unnamed protein product [Leptosia nina]|uniref:Uncharacterized protein n=1 Tax=Leptosia nina TaxID=320188 RepID=A0AAV1JP06_9NEOP
MYNLVSFPEPAVHSKDIENEVSSQNNSCDIQNKSSNRTKERRTPGTLPQTDFPKGARGLLMKLLETNPQYRLKSLRQLQQTAFYMGFNFDEVRAKRILPKSILQQYQDDSQTSIIADDKCLANMFSTFDQNIDL